MCMYILQGFVISDWQGVDKIEYPSHSNYPESVRKAIMAGVDMVMLPFNHTEFIEIMTDHVANNRIPMSRIDDAVRRILRVKYAMGLFEQPLAEQSLADQLGSQVHQFTHNNNNSFYQ